MSYIRSLVKNTRGASMVEYVIMVGVIAVVALGCFQLFGSTIKSKIKGQNDVVNTNVDTTTSQ